MSRAARAAGLAMPDAAAIQGQHRDVRGFTLLELVVVTLLLAIISAVVVPVYNLSMSSMTLRNTQNDLIAVLSFIQARAVAEGREYRLYLDDDEQTWWVERFETEEGDFVKVREDYGRLHKLPARYEFDRIKANRARGTGAYYISCFPSGACDFASIRIQHEHDRQMRFEIETKGVMGRAEVTEAAD